MSTRFLLTLVFCFGALAAAKAQCPYQVNELVISTGYDPVTQALVPNNSFDPMWRLTQAAPDPPGWISAIGGPAAIVPIYSAWSFAGSNSKYINAYPTNQSLTDNWNLNTNPYVFERTFCLCATENSIVPFYDVTFDLALNADNWAELTLVKPDGSEDPLVALPYVYSTNNFRNQPATANVTMSLPLGEYTLRLYHRNKLVVMGVNLEGTITSSALVDDAGCSDAGTIAGFMYEDVNGNEIKDNGDLMMANRKINLLSRAGATLQSAITDNSGYYFFMDLEPGVYNLAVADDPDWTVTVSSSGTAAASIETNEVNSINLRSKSTLPNEYVRLAVNLPSFQASPNPGNGSFLLEFDRTYDNEVQVRVLDQMGRVVHTEAATGNQHKLNLPGAKKGIYFVQITANGYRSMRKVLVN